MTAEFGAALKIDKDTQIQPSSRAFRSFEFGSFADCTLCRRSGEKCEKRAGRVINLEINDGIGRYAYASAI